MARACDLCEKKSLKGNKIKLIWGVKYRSIKHRKPNLRKLPLLINGKRVQSKICAKCLRSAKNNKIPNVSIIPYTSKETKVKEKAKAENIKIKEKESKSKKKSKKDTSQKSSRNNEKPKLESKAISTTTKKTASNTKKESKSTRKTESTKSVKEESKKRKSTTNN